VADTDDRRDRGRAMMKQVYGWDVGEPGDRFVELTVDHLFGEIWAEGTMSVREKRLVLLGLLVGSGQDDVVGLQLDAALRLDELSPAELRELVVFIAHYAGWPRGARLNSTVEDLIARAQRAPRSEGV
jgi:4-carboxymuconolactone decarboxylase